MRLTDKEVTQIKKSMRQFPETANCKLFLFGSRLADNKRGGDIDLLLLCPEDQFSELLAKKFLIKATLEFDLDDQRVDLTLVTQKRIKEDLFLSQVFADALEL